MTDTFISELRTSWEIASPRGDELFARFYDLLFQRTPRADARHSLHT